MQKFSTGLEYISLEQLAVVDMNMYAVVWRNIMVILFPFVFIKVKLYDGFLRPDAYPTWAVTVPK